jgi:hypothetical protein
MWKEIRPIGGCTTVAGGGYEALRRCASLAEKKTALRCSKVNDNDRLRSSRYARRPQQMQMAGLL